MPFVDATGLQIKTIEEIIDELATQQKADIDATLNTAVEEPIGQLNGIFAAQIREVWELAQVAYNGFNPDAVEGFLQEKLSALTGTVRAAATKSLVALDCDLNIGTTLTAGSSFANVVGEPDNRWTPSVDFTAPAGGVQSVNFEAEFAGAVVANSGTITVISTPVVGWNSVTNPLDAAVGEEIETDAELRQRREEELRATGSATVDAIRADVLADNDVTQCSVFENVSGVIDANGLPPKSIEVVVFDGTPPVLADDDIAQLIWNTKAAGIETYGLESGTALDSLQNQHTIFFSRPSEVEVWLEIDLDIDIVSGYAGSAAVEAAVVKLNETDLLLSRDVILQRISQVCIAFAGVIDVTEIRAGKSAAPVGIVNVEIGPREIGVLDTSRITIAENLIAIP